MKSDDVFHYNQDLTGRTFGYWTVLKKIGRYSSFEVPFDSAEKVNNHAISESIKRTIHPL